MVTHCTFSKGNNSGNTNNCGEKTRMCLPLADNFLVLIILAAYSCPVHSLTHLRTTEKAPL